MGEVGLATAYAYALSLCGQSWVMACNEVLAMLEIFYVALQKRGGEILQPMVRVSGMDTICSPPWFPW